MFARKVPKNFYKTLDVPSSSTPAQIKGAYLKLVMVWHPDKNSKPEAPDRFRDLQAAYDVLMDPVTRGEHDRDIGASASGAYGDNSQTFRPNAGQSNWKYETRGYDHPGRGPVNRPAGAPGGTKSGEMFDEDIWVRMHYNEIKKNAEKEILLEAEEARLKVGTPFANVDTRVASVRYMGSMRTSPGGEREVTQQDIKKNIAAKLQHKRDARIKHGRAMDKMEIGGSCVLS
jgi:curved DNA-binding protein CbpA